MCEQDEMEMQGMPTMHNKSDYAKHAANNVVAWLRQASEPSWTHQATTPKPKKKRRTLRQRRITVESSMGVPIFPGRRFLLEHEDELNLESATDIAILPKQYTLTFEARNLGLALKSGPMKGKKILDGVTGKISPGKVTAVMGPSGAGKTTFLSTLLGKASYGVTTGEVNVNGKLHNVADFKTITGFVPQEDIMLRNLKVRECLQYQAMLRLPADMPRETKMASNPHITPPFHYYMAVL